MMMMPVLIPLPAVDPPRSLQHPMQMQSPISTRTSLLLFHRLYTACISPLFNGIYIKNRTEQIVEKGKEKKKEKKEK